MTEENPVIILIRKEVKNELEKRGIASNNMSTKGHKGLTISNLPMLCKIVFKDDCSVSVQFVKKISGYGSAEFAGIEFKASKEICDPKFDPQEIISNIIVLLDHLNAIRTMGSNPVDLSKLPLDLHQMKKYLRDVWKTIKQNGLTMGARWGHDRLHVDIEDTACHRIYFVVHGYRKDDQIHIVGSNWPSPCESEITNVSQFITDMIKADPYLKAKLVEDNGDLR